MKLKITKKEFLLIQNAVSNYTKNLIHNSDKDYINKYKGINDLIQLAKKLKDVRGFNMEDAWLIEKGKDNGNAWFLTLDTTAKDLVVETIENNSMKVLWTGYNMLALRFAREVDAQSWADTVFGEGNECKIENHQWKAGI